MKIAFGCDHGGFIVKESIIEMLKKEGHEVIDCGTYSTDSCNYPEFAHTCAEKVKNGEADKGILVCSSGEGVCIVANKVRGIRCGLGYNDDVSHLIVEHNHANMIAFGAKFMKEEDILRRINIFLNAYEEHGRHDIRVEMINKFEE